MISTMATVIAKVIPIRSNRRRHTNVHHRFYPTVNAAREAFNPHAWNDSGVVTSCARSLKGYIFDFGSCRGCAAYRSRTLASIRLHVFWLSADSRLQASAIAWAGDGTGLGGRGVEGCCRGPRSGGESELIAVVRVLWMMAAI